MSAAATPAISVILVAPTSAAAPPRFAERALARSDVAEIVRAEGPFAGLGPAFAAAAARCSGELVVVLTPDAEAKRGFWRGVRAVAQSQPDAGVFTLPVRGLTADPAWRGRRCRSHERNFESLRFADLVPPGGLVVRRELLAEAVAGMESARGVGWWRELVRRLAAATRIERLPITVRRRAALPGEPPHPGFAAPDEHRLPRVVVLGQIEVSTSLYFDFLEAQDEVSVGFRPLTGLGVDGAHLAAADLVILVRELHRFWDEGVIDFLRAAGTPFIYFTDDNFLALQGERSGFYTARRMRRALAGAREVWASTPALAAALAPLHPTIRVWCPVLDPALHQPAPAPSGKLTIALAGGDFRLGGLDGAPMEQLRALVSDQAVKLVVTEAAADVLGPALPGAEIVRMAGERSFRQFVRQWRRHGVDLLLHPAGATANAPYKCPTAVIVAGYLGAIPVVADEPAYDGWGEAEGVLRIGEDGLAAAARGLAVRDWRAELRGRLAGTLELRFNDLGRVETLRDVLGPERAEPGAAAADILGSPQFGLRRAGRRLVRLARRVRARG